MLQVADVLADERLSATTSVTVFLRSAPTARIGTRCRQRAHGAGRIAARPAQDRGTERSGAHHGVVHAPRDGALAGQERIGNAGEPFARVLILIGDGLAGAVRAGHHQDLAAHRRRTADDAAARRAASRRVRRCPAPPPASRFARGASTIGRARSRSAALPLPAMRSDQLAGVTEIRAPSRRTASPCGICARAARGPRAAFRASHAR